MNNLNQSFNERLVGTYKEFLGSNLIAIILFGSRARMEAKSSSDYDLFIIAEELPSRPLQRLLFIRSPLKAQFNEKISIIAKTREEVLNNFPPLFLDLGLDGIALYDKGDFFKNLQVKIREIVHQAGLKREKMGGEFYWKLEKPPQKGWEITWRGYREL